MARGRKISQEDIKHLLKIVIIMIGLYSFYKYKSTNWIYFFGVLFAGFILPELIFWFVPSRNLKPSKETKKKKTTKNQSNKNVTSKNLTDEQLLTANIDTLSGTDFERLMAMYYRDKGYSVQIVGGSGDHEVDLILKGKDGLKIAVQCKRWKKDVGNDIVLRLNSGKRIHGCYDAWLVTTSYFTKSAKEAADGLNIKLIYGLQVQDMISRWRKEKEKRKAK